MHIKYWVEGLLGRIHLDRPAALNTLTIDMVAGMHAALDLFESGPVHAILITGEGPRAFCAGGDIRFMYESGRIARDQTLEFWRNEYRLNLRINRLRKPWIAWMDGIVMGGGAGISVHGSHRLVTRRTKFAMPEVGIGYFPDVGGSWFLAHAPGELGTYLALTGAVIDGADAIACDMADACLPDDALGPLIARLAAGENVGRVVADLAIDPGQSRLEDHRSQIDHCFAGDDVSAIIQRLRISDAVFLQDALRQILRNAPISLVLALHMLRAGRMAQGLDECLQREMAGNHLALDWPDFYEGIRAAVIDKDRSPKWSVADVAQVDTASLFESLRQKFALEQDWQLRSAG